MDWPFRRLEAGKLDAGDETFRVRRRYPAALAASVSSAGVRAPLLVQPAASGWRLVSGWGRWLHRGSTGLLPCYELPADLEPWELWTVFLRDNDRWNVLEVARVLERLAAVPGSTPERLVAEALPLLGLHAATDVHRRHLQLLQLGPLAQELVETEDLPLRRAAGLLKLEAAALEAFVALARELRFTLNELNEALEWLEEIAHRERIAPERVLSALRAAPGWPAKDAVRRALRERRFPELARLTAGLEALRAELRFTVPVEVTWDPRLERPGIRLAADLATPQALETFRRELEENREALRRVFDTL